MTTTSQQGLVLHRDFPSARQVVSADDETPHVWLCDLDSVHPEEVVSQAALSADELLRAVRLKSSVQRERFLRSRQVLRTLLASILDIEPAAIQWQLGRWGKPGIANSVAMCTHCPLQFNLACAENWLAVAVAWGNEIGVDLEIIRPEIDPVKLAAAHFSPREGAELGRLSLPDRRERFYQLWTLKEAHLTLEHQTKIGDFMEEHRHALNANPKREARASHQDCSTGN